MSWQDIVKNAPNVTIKIGDWVEVKSGSSTRSGIITTIGISMSERDPAAEDSTAAKVESYYLPLDYKGAISYTNNTGEWWSYFNKITKVISQDSPEFQEVDET